MEQVEVLPGGATAFHVHTKLKGFDFDHDGLGEFVRAKKVATTFSFDFFESVADNTFQSVHALNLAATLSDGGDVDEDGLADLLIKDDDFVRVYESASANSYPDQIQWEFLAGAVIARYAETDGDTAPEIVIFGRPVSSENYHLRIFENTSDNTFEETYDEHLVSLTGGTQMIVAQDLDGDGKQEILMSGSGGGKKILAYESTGDNAYQSIWSQFLTYDGEQLNPTRIVDGGDLDGDGRNEFLVGGLLANSAPSLLVFHLFESTADNEFEIVFTFSELFGTLESTPRASIADVDGDGKREIALGSGTTVRVFQNTGDNAWTEWWSTITDNLLSLSAGDHDGDGKDELVVGAGFWPNGETAVWEVRLPCAADLDEDTVVDVIDNCPTEANSDQADGDVDGAGDLCDCLPEDAGVFAEPLEIMGVRWLNDAETIEWNSDAPNSGLDTVYDVVRGDLDQLPVGGAGEVCLEPDSGDTNAEDISTPVVGAGFYYLVRGKNACGIGSYGADSAANPRTTVACP